MKSHTEYLTFNIPARMDLRNITSQVEAWVWPGCQANQQCVGLTFAGFWVRSSDVPHTPRAYPKVVQ
ncbi:MAG TPA: hypothetical protein VG013_18305 [Gemmataceae bacterium]|jgi:hypothetical protein|nr:hypothetical protein [Gemmataceae bacterium]